MIKRDTHRKTAALLSITIFSSYTLLIYGKPDVLQMTPDTKRLAIALLLSINLHLFFALPHEYAHQYQELKIPKLQKLEVNLSTQSLLDSNIKTVSKEKNLSTSNGFVDGNDDFLSNITVPDEITDVSARFKQPLEIDETISSAIQSLKLKIFINRYGFATKVEILDVLEEKYAQEITRKIMAQEFEPAIYKGKPVNSIITGEIYLIN